MLSQQILEATNFLINTFGFQATQLAIESNRIALTTPETKDLLKYQLPRHEQSSAEYHVIETRLDAIEKCTRPDIGLTFSGYELAAESILSLLNANTWDEISNILQTAQGHLLPEIADVAFADLLMQPAPDKEKLHILSGWNLVKMCRALGIEEAISQYRTLDIEESGEVPVEALQILQDPDGQWGLREVEESGEVPLRPKRWLPALDPDSRGFSYLTSVHSNEEYNHYLNQALEQDVVSYYGFLSTRLAIEKHLDELILPQVREVLAYGLLPRRYEIPSPAQEVAEARLNAIEDCVKHGIDIDTVFSGYEAATKAVLVLLKADDWNEIREAVESNRHSLLPKVSDIAFADLVTQPLSKNDSDDLQDHILGGWNLIKQCRQLGVEVAFENQLRRERGIIIKPQSPVFSKLAAASSSEEIHKALQELELVRRQEEAQAQAQMWKGFDTYQAAINALVAPEDVPKRIEICRAALGELDRERMFLLWAMVSLDLADSLRKQIQQQAAPDMTEVISHYEDALTILKPVGEPEQFGHAHHYLGDAYLLHSRGDPAENIENAIDHYQKALGMRRPKVEPIPWATTMAHLGEALNRRLLNDRTINLDRAVDVVEQAIEVLKNSDKKYLLSSAYVSLGVALSGRTTGSTKENLERAAANFKQAIETIEPSSPNYNQVWVMANGNLGALYWNKAHVELWDYSALLEQAETHFRLALDRMGAETSSLVQARLHMGFGLVLSDSIHAGSELHEEAIHHFEVAIGLLEAEKSTSVGDLGLAYHNLATIYLERKEGERQANIQSAESFFLKALETLSIKDFPVHRRDTLRAFGMMYFDEEEWEKASTHLQKAIQISEEILGGCYTEPGKEAEVTQNRNLYSHAVYCLLKQKRVDLDRALETLEQGKARMLNEVLGWKDLDVSTLSEEQQQALVWARDQIVRLEAENRSPQIFLESGQKARLGKQLAEAYRHIEKLRREVSNVSIVEIDIRTILQEIPIDGALVAPIVTPKGGAAFVVPYGVDSLSEEHVVHLDSLTIALLGELMAGSSDPKGWLSSYQAWVEGADQFEELQEGLDHLVLCLWDILMGAIYKRLRKFGVVEQAPVVVIPSGWLGLFPLHAAVGYINGQRRTFGEFFTVSYAPSVRILGICRQRLTQSQRKGKKLLAVVNPTGDLRFAEAGCEALKELFIQQQQSSEAAILLPRSNDLRSQIVQNLKQTNYHHFYCHGMFNWTNPAESGLKLAPDDWLTLVDILSSDVELSTSRLVTLSACETGLTEFKNMPDEFIGLAGAFLEGGTPAIVSTLWQVEEVSTHLLITKFYRLHLEKKLGIAAALRSAQIWLKTSSASQLGLVEEYRRLYEASENVQEQEEYKKKWEFYRDKPDEIPFQHPFYWAAFTITGSY